MSWSGFAAALVAALVLQTTVVSVLDLPIDLFLVLALICGLVLPVHDACLAAWITGFAQDLTSLDPLGLHAFCLGLVGWAMTRVRDLLNVHVWWTRGITMFIASLIGLVPEEVFRIGWLQQSAGTWLGAVLSPIVPAAVGALLATIAAGLPWFVIGRRHHRFRPVRQL